MENKEKFRNRARCRHCGDVIESKHLHDHVRCSCGAIELDGGTEIPRMIGAKLEDFLEHPLAIERLREKREQEMAELWAKTWGVAQKMDPDLAYQYAQEAETEEEQKFWLFIEDMRRRMIANRHYT